MEWLGLGAGQLRGSGIMSDELKKIASAYLVGRGIKGDDAAAMAADLVRLLVTPAASAKRPRCQNAEGKTLEFTGSAWVPIDGSAPLPAVNAAPQ
jgi:hypothetical protein